MTWDDPKSYPRNRRRTVWKRLRVLWLLWCVSRMHKSQRFGQILFNYGLDKASLFYSEDWQIVRNLKREIHRKHL